jgi:hypothetical protein
MKLVVDVSYLLDLRCIKLSERLKFVRYYLRGRVVRHANQMNPGILRNILLGK